MWVLAHPDPLQVFLGKMAVMAGAWQTQQGRAWLVWLGEPLVVCVAQNRPQPLLLLQVCAFELALPELHIRVGACCVSWPVSSAAEHLPVLRLSNAVAVCSVL